MLKQLKPLLGVVAVACLCILPSRAATSATPGMLNYVEGQASVNGQPVTTRSVGSVQLEPNQVLETGRGRAEILLTPGIFLRIGDNSSVRMVSPNLMDTRVQVLRGEALIEANYVPKDSNIRLMLGESTTRLEKHGLYSFNANTGQVSVLDGKAVVQENDQSVELGKGRLVMLAALKKSSFDTKTAEQQDPLYTWSRLRSEYDSQAAIQTASTVVVGGPGWWGPGWYWNPWWGMYSFLPGTGFLYSPFGWPYYSPGFVYLAPGFRYGYGFVGHGFAAAPHVSGGFGGGGFRR